MALTILPMTFVTMPAMSATLRCVKQEKSSLAVGIQVMMMIDENDDGNQNDDDYDEDESANDENDGNDDDGNDYDDDDYDDNQTMMIEFMGILMMMEIMMEMMMMIDVNDDCN